MKTVSNQNPEHTCREGKTLLWKAKTLDDQTRSHCEFLHNAMRRGKMQSSADLRQKGQGDLIHGTGASTLSSKRNVFIRYCKI